MSIAWLSGLIILVILIIMLIAGAPIAISLAVSSICAILPVLSTEPALVTGAQRIFSGISVFNLERSGEEPLFRRPRFSLLVSFGYGYAEPGGTGVCGKA